MTRVEAKIGPLLTMFFSAADDYPGYVDVSPTNLRELTEYIFVSLARKLGEKKLRLGVKNDYPFPNDGVVQSKRYRISRDPHCFARELGNATEGLIEELGVGKAENGVFVLEVAYSQAADNAENLFQDFGYLFGRLVKKSQ